MSKESIYLDHNATAPLRPCAQSMLIQSHARPLNASSIHSFGREGRKYIEKARTNLSQAINCPAAQITFNSGATEGNNTILKYCAQSYPHETILVSAIEHPSIIELKDQLPQIKTIPVGANGTLDLEALETLLKTHKTSLVSLMFANNETGALQPIKEAASLAHSNGALFHCDATQALGRIAIDMQDLAIDALTVSSHKIGGPQGVGALAIGLCGITPALLHGGGQEKKLRAGTENVAGIAAFGAAIEEACTLHTLQAEHARLMALQTYLETQLLNIAPETIIHATNTPRLPNTTLFSLQGTKAHSLLMALDLEKLALSNGSACSSGTVKQSHVLQAMDIQPNIASAALRLSTGWNTSQADIDNFLTAWQKITQKQKKL